MYVCMITTTDMFLLYMTSFKNAWFLNEWSINLFSSLKLEKIITIEYFLHMKNWILIFFTAV